VPADPSRAVVVVALTVAVAVAPAPAGAASGAYDAYLAPASACPGSDVPTLLASEQMSAMLCLIDYARGARGLAALSSSPLLASSAGAKADDIVRCDDFSHTACGRTAEAPFEQSGYISPDVSWTVGENLAFGSDLLGSPRSIMRAWLESDAHRENLFGEQWRDQGVALRKPAALLGITTETVWVSHFGRRDSAVAAAPAAGNAPGSGSGPAAASAMRITVRPARARSGRRTRFRFVVTAGASGAARAVRGAIVSFASRRVRTDARGRATIVAILRRRGRHTAIATKASASRAKATVRVIGRR
jgi:uncharacterized protein YkwD